MKKLFVFIFAISFVSFAAQAQEKPVRVGLKFGIPNIAGLNAEYVTPLLNKRLAASVDFSYFSISAGDSKVALSYFELGGNYYFLKEGKGLYGNLSYGRIGTSIDFQNVSSETGSNQGGSASASLGINLFNLKLGGKFGNTFYFRPEVGYALASVADTIDVTVTFPDGTTENQSQSVPGIVGGGLVLNLGFGFAF